MAKISALPQIAELTGEELLPIVQSGTTKRATMTALRAMIVPFLQNWYKGDEGDRGPQGYSAVTLAQLKSAPTTDGLLNHDRAVFEYRTDKDYSSLWNDVYYIESDLGGTGAWVRQGADKVSFYGPAPDERPIDTATLFQTAVDVRRFGAKCDAVINDDGTLVSGTNDRAAIQRCVDYCLSFRRPLAMLMPGMSLIDGPLFIDRFVDQTRSEFHIIGQGGGIYADSAINMFDTRIPATNDPRSEYVVFHNMTFEGSDPTTELYVASWKFLRIRFNESYFRRTKVVKSPIYLQSWTFTNNIFRNFAGISFECAGVAFDCKWIGNAWEASEAGDGIKIGASCGCSILSNVFEGSRRFLSQDGGNGLAVVGNYTEANLEPDYSFTTLLGSGTARGIFFSGNLMIVLLHDLFNVTLGDVRGFNSAGNYCNNKLFDLTQTRVGRVNSIGDHAEFELFSRAGSQRTMRGHGLLEFLTNITAHAGGGRANATPLIAALNILTTVAADGDSVALPNSDDLADPGLARVTIVRNEGAAIATVFQSAADLANFGATGSWSVAPGETAYFYQTGQGLAFKG